MRTAWAAAILILTWQAYAGEITGEELLLICTGAEKVSPHACDSHIADARVQANVAIASLEQQAGREPFSACVRANIDPKLYREMVLIYLRNIPEWRQLDVSEVMTRMMLTAYPCN